MRVSQVLVGLAALAASSVASAQYAYDDASDPAYTAGWADGSNGGHGFNPWIFYNDDTTTHFSTGDSTISGAHVGINTAGRALSMSSVVQTSTCAAIRYFTTPVAVGQTFSVDVLDQDVSGQSLSRIEFGCTNGNAGELNMSTNQMFLGVGGGDSWNFSLPTVGGIRFEVTPQASGALAMKLTSLQTGAVESFLSGDTQFAPLTYFDVVRFGTGLQDQTFVNRMQVVPEPSVLAVLGFGLLIARRRRR